MASSAKNLPDLERDIPLAKADFDVMWRSREQRPMPFQEYLDFLSSIAIRTPPDELPPFIEPFEL